MGLIGIQAIISQTRNNAGQQSPLRWTCEVNGGSAGSTCSVVFNTAWLLRSSQLHLCSRPLIVLGYFLLPALPPFFGKCEVQCKFPCSTVFLFFSVMVPGGCCLQGCHGQLTCSALVLVAPLSFQAHLLQAHLLLIHVSLILPCPLKS